MAGLTIAYNLSKNPANNVLILEKDKQPYSGISAGGGCWFAQNFSRSFMNRPFYPDITRAIFDHEKNSSRIYLRTFVQDWASINISLKFGLLWLTTRTKDVEFMEVADNM